MFLAKIVFVAFTITNYVYVAGQDANVDTAGEGGEDEEKPVPDPEENRKVPKDSHTFVVLIDIVFTDGLKRTCTGTIIHDNVVITAAHCFIVANKDYVEIELTTSFVVIGTKKMYDTGYENYLPIERVIFHPKYKGWTADLALVFTFAGMTSDKPGNVIPLDSESIMTPVDSNVTVLSWGQCEDELVGPLVTQSSWKVKEKSAEDDSGGHDHYSTSRYSPLRKEGHLSRSSSSSEVDSFLRQQTHQEAESEEVSTTVSKRLKQSYLRDRPKEPTRAKTTKGYKPTIESDETTPKVVSRYLTSSETKGEHKDSEKEENPYTPRHRYHKAYRNSSIDDRKVIVLMLDDEEERFLNITFGQRRRFSVVKHDVKVKKKPQRVLRSFNQDDTRRGLELFDMKKEREILLKHMSKDGFKIQKTAKEQRKPNEMQIYYKDWRRQIGTKQNKLTVKNFGFVNVQTCKRIVDKAMPAIYSITDTNYVVCYAAEDHYISDEDSGAPVIRQGHLVAVTLGGVECEGDHVAIGIKMSCFCPWIAENMPDGGKNMKCYKNCCESNNVRCDSYDNNMDAHKHRNK